MDLKSIPKVALHRHLELSVRHSTIKELAPQFGFDVSTQEKFAEKFLLTAPMADPVSYTHLTLPTTPYV